MQAIAEAPAPREAGGGDEGGPGVELGGAAALGHQQHPVGGDRRQDGEQGLDLVEVGRAGDHELELAGVAVEEAGQHVGAEAGGLVAGAPRA
ncbi:MAG: hypothetical protein ACK559_38810, partial [bacterium]